MAGRPQNPLLPPGGGCYIPNPSFDYPDDPEGSVKYTKHDYKAFIAGKYRTENPIETTPNRDTKTEAKIWFIKIEPYFRHNHKPDECKDIGGSIGFVYNVKENAEFRRMLMDNEAELEDLGVTITKLKKEIDLRDYMKKIFRSKDSKEAEDPKAEDPKAEDPKAEDPKAEDPKAEDPKAECPEGSEDPKAEGPKRFVTFYLRAKPAYAIPTRPYCTRDGKKRSHTIMKDVLIQP
ncbi:hypothetical protein SLS60_010808 [Paraconiothyrium brasiliense]|uniref:Uncharacterized protein n=1 Tax=Paraconiothyrium brasiliense TaxID=300254 RepID=A0ABR3QM15_9PLEO